MNILICSVGRRVKLIEYFKRELNEINGKVVAVDCDPTAPALYFADQFEIVPRIDQHDYVQEIKALCKKYEISAVLSLIDPELSLLARYKEKFKEDGVAVIVSDEPIIEICFDKYLTSTFLQEHGLPHIPTYTNIEEVRSALGKGILRFPLIIKPRNGSASMGIQYVTTITQLQFFYNHDVVIQPFIEGEEFGVDCYIDLITKEATNIFMKKKIKMRAGETDKSVAVKDPRLRELMTALLEVLQPVGPIDIDCFYTEQGYVISEINPRFGGGYLHAHAMGQNFVKNLVTNLQNIANVRDEENYQEGKILIKYDHYLVL
ncbi:carbamoyl phosphate synthase [Robertmurraya siralis]|uniref:Carbamoyl phosphate synthase n=1 Tax=Robertmurraya siralis TaxID=77777 RepID=A0A919WHB0_9BACI|nr:ATP-grasp domain-containing protein [Robertmurraya siralis]PAE18659.1 carbamoylphosphate synthase large subunit [Bacillus sp. 7504-2]GIN61993.1 carbamoyl phosphate synthase [Robertmurraya siralis]